MPETWSAYSFYALVQTDRDTVEPRRIATTAALQQELTSLFNDQADLLVDPEIDRVTFDGRYFAGKDEVFEITDFELPAQIEEAISTPDSVPLLKLARVQPRIKAIFAGSYHAESESIFAVFQEFNSARLLTKSRTILHSRDTFHQLKQEGLTLADRCDAVFDGGAVYFQSFYKTNRFLDLTAYFHDATDAEIKEVFKDKHLVAEDEEQTLLVADQWMRRRFGIVMQTKILEKVTARKIKDAGKTCKLDIRVKRADGKEAIVMPKDKKEAKRLLTFLCEGYFHGELTKQLYISNSHKPVATR